VKFRNRNGSMQLATHSASGKQQVQYQSSTNVRQRPPNHARCVISSSSQIWCADLVIGISRNMACAWINQQLQPEVACILAGPAIGSMCLSAGLLTAWACPARHVSERALVTAWACPARHVSERALDVAWACSGRCASVSAPYEAEHYLPQDIQSPEYPTI